MQFFLVAANGVRRQVEATDREHACALALRAGAAILSADGQTLQSPLPALGLDRPGLFEPYGPGWQAPTGAEVRALLRVGGLSGSAAARVVGVDGRTIRKWTGDERDIPYSAWRLLCIYLGVVAPERLPAEPLHDLER